MLLDRHSTFGPRELRGRYLVTEEEMWPATLRALLRARMIGLILQPCLTWNLSGTITSTPCIPSRTLTCSVQIGDTKPVDKVGIAGHGWLTDSS